MKLPVKLILLLFTLLPAHAFGFAQSGGITGEVSEARIGPLIYAQVSVSTAGAIKHVVLTDYDGRFLVRPLPPGTYDVTVTCKGQRDITRQVVVPSTGLVTVNVSFPRTESDESSMEPTESMEHAFSDGGADAGAIATR